MSCVTLTKEAAQQVRDAIDRAPIKALFAPTDICIPLHSEDIKWMTEHDWYFWSVGSYWHVRQGMKSNAAGSKTLTVGFPTALEAFSAAKQKHGLGSSVVEPQEIGSVAGSIPASGHPAPQAQDLTQPDLQRMWNDAMSANRQSTTDAAMDFAREVLAKRSKK